MSDEHSRLADLASELARDAAELLAGMFRTKLRVSSKATPADVVSEADHAAQALIEDRLRTERPDDGLLAEEDRDTRGPSGLRWVVDPLDGTANYLHGVPIWCVSVACEDDQGSVAGAIFDPCREELFRAVLRGGATVNGRTLEPFSGEAPPLAEALVCGSLDRLTPHTGHARDFGSAALEMAWTAAGRCDAFQQAAPFEWDVAAGTLMCTEAGLEVHRSEAAGICAGPASLVAEIVSTLG